MVVADGVTLVDPLADVEVNVPGVIATLVAPATAQFSELLVPEFTPVGFAVKEVIAGAEPFAGDGFEEPQSTSPAQAIRMKTSAQRSGPEELNPREPRLFPQHQ